MQGAAFLQPGTILEQLPPSLPPTPLKVQRAPFSSQLQLTSMKQMIRLSAAATSIFLLLPSTKRFFTPSSPLPTCTTHILLAFFLSPVLFFFSPSRSLAAFPSQNEHILISSSKMLCFNACRTNTTSAEKKKKKLPFSHFFFFLVKKTFPQKHFFKILLKTCVEENKNVIQKEQLKRTGAKQTPLFPTGTACIGHSSRDQD